MFTGLIEATGTILNIDRRQGNRVFTIGSPDIAPELRYGESVSIDGVCLTVKDFSEQNFTVEAVEETLARTTLAHVRLRSSVNLERSLRSSDRLGGHFVLGHVDGLGTVEHVEHLDGSTLLSYRLPDELIKYCVMKGSIAVNGMSLTIARIQSPIVSTSIIPYTFEHTTIQYWKAGDTVNIEVDILAKYVENLLHKPGGSNMTENWLREVGFL